MDKIREIKIYQSYFTDYYALQNDKVKDKIKFVLYVLETQHFIPDTYVKHITKNYGNLSRIDYHCRMGSSVGAKYL